MPDSSQTHPTPVVSHGLTLRQRAIPLLVAILIEGVIGGQLSLAGSPYPPVYLWLHVGIAVLLVVFAGYAFLLSFGYRSTMAKASAGLTFLSALGATISGIIFLWGGGARGAFYGMEGLFGVALIGSILLLVFGGPDRPPSSTSAR